MTGLGFVPAVQAAEDGISAQWTTKENLAPADQEVMLRPEKGDLSEDSASEITGESNQYQDSDMVTVIVELEDAPLAEAAPTDVKSFAASTQGVALGGSCGAPRTPSRRRSGPGAARYPPSL